MGNEFQYQMLDRMRSDCEYFLGYGNRCEKHLWGKSVDKHINAMKLAWNQLPADGKPEWLSYEDICEYEKKMRG